MSDGSRSGNSFSGPFLELLLNTGEDLRPEQRAEFVENLAKRENLNPTGWRTQINEYRDDLEARFDKQLKRYMGPLTSEQTTHIEQGWRKLTRLTDSGWRIAIWIEA